MLTLYQDTKIGVAGITYTIPKSFYIAVEDDFCPVKNNGLIFTTRKKDCCIEVYMVESDISSNIRDDFISTICSDNIYTVHGKVDERIENSMYSIRAEYESRRHSYFEMHIGQRKGYDKRLQVLITAEKGKADIVEIMKREDVSQFIDSFEVIE